MNDGGAESDEVELRARLARPYLRWNDQQLAGQRDYWRARQIVAQREIDTTMRELNMIDSEIEERSDV